MSIFKLSISISRTFRKSCLGYFSCNQAVRQLTDGIDRRGLLLAGADRCLRELMNSFEDSPAMASLLEDASLVVWSTIEREEKS